MKDQSKTKQVLIQELASLRKRIAQLEKSESGRKRAEETLRESKERYNAIFDRSLDCIYVIDFDGNFIDANPAALNLLGYERTDIRSLNIVSLLDEKDLSKGLQDFSEIIQVGFQKEVGEYRLRCKDGRCITLETKASVVYHDDNPHSVLGIARDITDRKQVEEALKESSGRYKELSTLLESLFNAIPDVLGIQDHQHGIIRYNQAGYDFLGRTQEEVEGEKCFQLINGTKPCETCATSEVYRTKKPARVEKYIEDMGIWLDCRSYPVFDEKGNITKIIEHLRDITERKRAENELQKSEEKLRLITDNMSDMIRVTDLQGVNLYTSPSHFKSLGYKPEERVGKSAFDIVHPDDLERIISLFSEGLASNRRVNVEYRVRHADGRYVWLETVGDFLKDDQGNVTAVVMSSRDVSERRQSEETLRESETLQRTLLANLPAGVIIIDPVTRMIENVNNTAAAMFGVQTENIVGHRCHAFLCPASEGACPVCDLGKEVDNAEREMVCADGSRRPVLKSVKRIQVQGQEKLLECFVDITAQKQAEEAMRESEERYRSIFETTLEGIYQTSPQGRYLRVNPAFALMLGYDSPADLIGSITDIGTQVYVNPERRSEFRRRLSEQDRVENFEAQLYRKDGTTMWGLINGVTVRNENGEILYYTGGMMDITERKKAEEALRNSESKYQFLAENMADVVFTLDINLVTTYVSPSIERMLGFTPEERKIQKVDQQLTPKSQELVFDTLVTELEREKKTGPDPDRSQTLELEYYHKDGSIKYLVTYIRGIRDGAGNLTGFYGSHHDITERKRAESALQASEQKYRHLFEKAEEGILIVRGETIEFANPALARILGQPLERIIAHPFVSFIHSEDREMVFDRHRRRTRGETVETGYDFRIVTSDGDVRWLRITTRIIDWDDTPASLSFLIDVTDHKRAEDEKRELERQLHQAQKLESIGTLAGGIAHDFNNLLMGIQGYASLMLIDMDASHPHHERLKRIEQQVQHGADLTKQLLGFARGGRYEVRPTDMNDIIDRTSSMFGRTKKEIAVHRSLAENLWAVDCDQGQMEQVLMNLYVNAWQAMPGGGELCLETVNVLFGDDHALPSALKPGRYVKVSITDTGTGMDAKTVERIFDPFFTTKGMGRGTGLGLAMVYGIVKGHGGIIDVTSEPGQGTTFDIHLPASEKAIDKEKIALTAILTGTETVLLVDDEQMVLEVTRELLESLGYRVYAVGSGQEAIAVYMEKRKKIDLVILDMIMPGISGGETFDRLREIHSGIRVLLSSGYSINGEAQTIMDRGCSGFLQKPFQMENLSRKVREILD